MAPETLPKPDRSAHLARLRGPLEEAAAAGCAGLILVDSLNQYWATGYNVLAIPAAAGVFAWAGFALSPAAAAVLMSGSTIDGIA